jgi:hypothetical protein
LKLKLSGLLFAVSSLILLLGTLAAAQEDEMAISGDHYEWLLKSPIRHYLSSSAENFLALTFRPKVHFPGRPEEGDDKIYGLDLLVNDRTQDANPSLTTQSETAVALFGRTVVIGWNDVGQFPKTASFVGYGYSADGGSHFVDVGVVPPMPGGANLGDPDLAVDRGGNFYFSMIAVDRNEMSFIGVSKSSDGGRTFSIPVSASTIVSSYNSFQDKEFIIVDTTGGQFDSNIYVSWTRFSDDGAQIMFARSQDGGRTFQSPIALNSPGSYVSGSMPRVGPNGEVYVVWERFNTPGIHISKSLDGGRTFGSDGVAETLVSKVEFIGQSASPNTCEGRQVLNGYIDAGFEYPTMVIHPVNGEVYVVFDSNPVGVDESDLFFTRSIDRGLTWSDPVRLNDDSTLNDQFMPAMSIAPDGTIAVIWYDRRNDPHNLNFDVYLTTSKDGGRTWAPNKRINSVTSQVPPLGPNFDALRPCYMGDYNDIAADQNGFYIAWGDNRERGLTWKTLSEMPTPREATANAAIGNGVFVIGGTKLGFGEVGDSRLVEMYNTRTGGWQHLALMPTPRSYAAAVGVGFSIYVGAGQSSRYGGVTGALERYDAITNRWSSLPPLPTPRTMLGAAQVRNKLYFIGGQSCVSPLCGQTLDIVEVYDLSTKKWSEAAKLPDARAGFATVVIRGKIYVVGGFITKGVYTTTIRGNKGILQYDPATDSWQVVAAMNRDRMFPLAGQCGDKLIVSGGISPTTLELIEKDSWSLDIGKAEWEEIASPKFDRDGANGVTVGNELYAIGGSSDPSVAHSGANEAFDCAYMGSDRPDPNVFFAFEPLNSISSSAKTKSQPKFEVKSLQQSHALKFSVTGLDEAKSMRVRIFNNSGLEIFDSGETQDLTLQWNLETKNGRLAGNGVYLYLITARDKLGKMIQSGVRKILVLR